eukprot:scaffold1585_cov228-Skeletonema_marinoi.AAC.2
MMNKVIPGGAISSDQIPDEVTFLDEASLDSDKVSLLDAAGKVGGLEDAGELLFGPFSDELVNRKGIRTDEHKEFKCWLVHMRTRSQKGASVGCLSLLRLLATESGLCPLSRRVLEGPSNPVSRAEFALSSTVCTPRDDQLGDYGINHEDVAGAVMLY